MLHPELRWWRGKGVLHLGVLKEIEDTLKCPLSSGSIWSSARAQVPIIAALIALGYEVDEIHTLYKEHVPRMMRVRSPEGKSKTLEELASTVFADNKFDAVKTGIGIVTTKWVIEKPMIFNGNAAQAHGRVGTFAPGFGCTISDAVQALRKDIPTIRISDTFQKPDMATDLFEHNLDKLNILRQRGSESFASREAQFKDFLL
jgi:hypothetical protein